MRIADIYASGVNMRIVVTGIQRIRNVRIHAKT